MKKKPLCPRKIRPASGFFSPYFSAFGKRLPVDAGESFLAKEALESLYAAQMQIMEAGGKLLIASMWRDPIAQYKKFLDYKLGIKASYSPPPGLSMHEVGRAIDIETREEVTKLPHELIRSILKANGWTHIKRLNEPGDYHYEFRGPKLAKLKEEFDYKQMMLIAWRELHFDMPTYPEVNYDAEKIPNDWE